MKTYETINVYFDMTKPEEKALYDALRQHAFENKGYAMSTVLKEAATKIMKKRGYLQNE